ncbi:cystatin-like protein [Drosophila sulfurigaster albostrigata]|uniref:cystatin-like protein n=1 Tax=Drosophila sulfurigaster albostrigata TaxID=89887 RepID=UPI002D21ACF9|nr:cystatin-like protein [Drosophila sulfurigaster albostrigata]
MIGSKLFYFTIFAVVCVSLAQPVRVGGPRELQGNDLREAIDNLDAVLAKLATGDGPSYRVVKVTKVTVQVVAGSLHTYTVELDKSGASKQCTVKIWSQPWLDRTSTKIECEGDDKPNTW